MDTTEQQAGSQLSASQTNLQSSTWDSSNQGGGGTGSWVCISFFLSFLTIYVLLFQYRITVLFDLHFYDYKRTKVEARMQVRNDLELKWKATTVKTSVISLIFTISYEPINSIQKASLTGIYPNKQIKSWGAPLGQPPCWGEGSWNEMWKSRLFILYLLVRGAVGPHLFLEFVSAVQCLLSKSFWSGNVASFLILCLEIKLKMDFRSKCNSSNYKASWRKTKRIS